MKKTTEPFLVNPPKRRKRIRAHGRFGRNPMGELMVVGANPFKFGGGNVSKKYKRKRVHKNPYGAFKRKRKRYRRNPPAFMAGVDTSKLVPQVLSITSGVLAVDAFPVILSRFLPAAGTGIMSYVVKGAAIVGGGALAKKVGGKEAQVMFIAGGIGKLVLDLVGDTVLSMITSIGGGAPEAPTEAAEAAGYGYITDEDGNMGAIVDEDENMGFDDESLF